MGSDAAMPTAPLLLLDVDGPLNPYAAKPHQRPGGYETHRWMTPRWEAAERRRLSEEGQPNKRPKPLRVWLNPGHGALLAELPVDLVWATTWEEEANTYVSPVLGLPELPFIAWPSPRSAPAGGVFWKTPSVVEWAVGRPFCWLDDDVTEADADWVAANHAGAALLRRIDPSVGLLPDDISAVAEWAAALTTRTKDTGTR
ncbi:hypothetical protein [Streptacidiphilus sp. MAP5-52]|uniref:hypothetical protein n=1 Tax=Streptacidiphilus sp. MAP5-52 TaxID=3156267 RepID=UPI003516B36C